MNEDNELINPDGQQLVTWETMDAEIKKTAKTLDELNEVHNLILKHRKTSELVDETFIIYGLNKFASKYKGQKYAYFAYCQDQAGDRFTTVFGGVAVIDILDKLIAVENTDPVTVTLRCKALGDEQTLYTIE